MIGLALALRLAFAEPEATPPPEDAAAAFDRGTAAYEAGDFATALAAFERAQTLSPHDRVRANIAMCLAELGRIDEAIAQLEGALAGTELDDAERTIVREQIAKLRARVPPPEPAPSPTIEPAPPEPVPPPRAPTPSSPTRVKPSAVLWTGLPLTVLGAAGVIAFGLRTRQHHDAYLAMPEPETRTRGLRMRALTNASIAVLSVGAVLVLTDVIRIAARRGRPSAQTSARTRRRSGML